MSSRVSYKFLEVKEKDAEDKKFPPQCATIIKTLSEMAAEGATDDTNPFPTIVSRDDLVKALDVSDGDRPNKLNANQPIERVIAFYQNRLKESGVLEIVKAAVAEKPVKEKKAKTGKTKVPGTAEDAAAGDPEATADDLKVSA